MGLRKNMTEALELPKEIMLGLPLISLLGREEVTYWNMMRKACVSARRQVHCGSAARGSA